jgi:tripartite-type tricarboxylate transporter receptor subunit TctC
MAANREQRATAGVVSQGRVRLKQWVGCLMVSAAVCVTFWPSAASADSSYPARPVKVVVPWSAGGATDVMGRILSERLSAKLGQSFVVDNKPGATGYIGTQNVINSPADGYTLLIMAASLHTFSPSVARSMPFDPVNDLTPVSVFSTFPSVVVVPEKSPYKTLADLVNAAKAKPGTLNYGSAGIGSASHLIPELLTRSTDARFHHIPYKGAAPAVADLLGGQIDFMIDSLPSPLPNIRAGKLRALAVTGSKRSPLLPDVPAVSETIPDFQTLIWLGVGAPRNLPAPIAEKLRAAIAEISQEPEYIARLRNLGVDAAASKSPQEFKTYLNQQKDLWKKVVVEAKIPMND